MSAACAIYAVSGAQWWPGVLRLGCIGCGRLVWLLSGTLRTASLSQLCPCVGQGCVRSAWLGFVQLMFVSEFL